MARARHRPFRALAATTALAGLIPAALGASIQDPAVLAGALFAWALASYLWAAGGTLVAAATYAPGDAMRPGWLLVSLSYAVLAPGRLVDGPSFLGLGGLDTAHPVLASISSVASAALGLAGFLVLARAWGDSGLDLGSRGARLALRAGALAVSLALAGPDLVQQLPAALAGDPMAFTDVLTDLCDGALFVVAAPVLRAALALGGGLVAWPWAFLSLSLLAWLGYDAAGVWGEALGLDGRTVRLVLEVMRSLGASAAFAAGVAQRWVMVPMDGAGDEPPSA